LDDPQGSIPSALTEKPHELRRTVEAKFAELPFYALE
jgi:hypothetical protein